MADFPPELASGLGDRYVAERELGRGGMATVWLVRDLRYDRPVALKVLHPDLAHSLGSERFLREIKLAARLQHPHVVSVYDSGAVQPEAGVFGTSFLWYTMPYVDGESLRERLRRDKTLPLQVALRITRGVAQALQYAHGQGVTHRDIKPENILLTRDGNVLVADFGIARPAAAEGGQHLTTAGMVVGTPSYMSPEQASGSQEVDGRSDIYSLGCVLYEMLAGEPPFTGLTAPAVIAQHLSKPAPTPDKSRAAVPDSVNRAIARALAKSPAERFADAAQFAEALEVTDVAPGKPSPRRVVSLVAALLAFFATSYWAATRVSLSRALAVGQGGTVASGLNRKLEQLTFAEGPEEWPAWSPDGGRLALVAEVDGFRQLFVRRLDGGEERLSHDKLDHLQPAWSPDGTRLVFVRATSPTGKLEPDDIYGHYFEGGEIWTMELGSRQERKLIDGAFSPAYSPTGDRIAFDAEYAGARRIWVADASGRNPRQVSSDSSEAVVHAQPRWSPDGSRLVFRRIEKTKSDIAVVDLGSQRLVKVTDDYAIDLDPVWSPDGRRLYFSSARGGGLNLWRVSVRPSGEPTGPLEQLTTGAGDDVQPAIAPDGQRMVFEVRGINSDLWTLPVSPGTGRATGEPAPLLATTRVESRGAWSPDGATIAFNSDRLGEMNIWLRSLKDSSERQLTTGSGGDYQPTWSPDGRSLVFFSARAGNTDIWSVQISDGKLARLTDHRALDTNPFYSPDGRWIAFNSDRSGRSELWLMAADGSQQRQLASVGLVGHFMLWTADSREVIFRAEGGPASRIFRVSIGSGGLTPLPEISSGGHMSFSPDRSIVMDVKGHKVVWAYPMDGSAPYKVFEFPDPDVRIDYPVWSPDGRSLLFDRAEPRGGDLWVLREEK